MCNKPEREVGSKPRQDESVSKYMDLEEEEKKWENELGARSARQVSDLRFPSPILTKRSKVIYRNFFSDVKL